MGELLAVLQALLVAVHFDLLRNLLQAAKHAVAVSIHTTVDTDDLLVLHAELFEAAAVDAVVLEDGDAGRPGQRGHLMLALDDPESIVQELLEEVIFDLRLAILASVVFVGAL